MQYKSRFLLYGFVFLVFLIGIADAESRLYVVQSIDESLGQVNLETNAVTGHVLSLCYLPNDVILHRG
jgi:hypothetical protein